MKSISLSVLCKLGNLTLREFMTVTVDQTSQIITTGQGSYKINAPFVNSVDAVVGSFNAIVNSVIFLIKESCRKTHD